MSKRLLLLFISVVSAVAAMGQITQQQTIGAPHTQVTNRGFLASDSAIKANADTPRNARINSFAIIGITVWVQAPHNVTDSSWQPIAGSSGSIPVSIGPIDSPTASVNGLVAINNRIYAQHVTPVNVGLLDPPHFINFEHAWAILKNSSTTSLFVYPDTPAHSAFTGTGSVFVGQAAGGMITSAGTNVGVGQDALFFDLTGGGNTAVGQLACAGCLLVNNTAVGVQALRNSTGGNSANQVAVGANALSTCTTCFMNDAVGYLGLTGLIDGQWNSAHGEQALQQLKHGNHNFAGGGLALNQGTLLDDCVAVGFGSNSGAGQTFHVQQSTTVGSLAADLNFQGWPYDVFGYESVQDDSTGQYLSVFGHRNLTRAGSDTLVAIFGDDNLSGPSPVTGFDRKNVDVRILGDSNLDNFAGTLAASVQHIGITIIGSKVQDNTDTSRSNVTEVSSNHKLTRNNYANFGDSTKVISMGREGMTTAQFNARFPTTNLLRTGDFYYNQDSAAYTQYDSAANYFYKWRKVITGSFSQSVVAVTTLTVTLPVSIPAANYVVSVTPTAALTATNYYVSAKGTSSFNVTFISALTGTVMFDWSVTQ
jgi:hypothetical protein